MLYDTSSDTKQFLLPSIVTSLISLYFLTLSIVFPKTALFITLKKYLSKSFFAFFLHVVLISMHGFSQDFWLNLMILCTFFKTNSWFNACFKFRKIFFIMQVGYKFFNFFDFFCWGKKHKSVWSSGNFLGY